MLGGEFHHVATFYFVTIYHVVLGNNECSLAQLVAKGDDRVAERILVQFSCRDLVIVHVRLIGLHLEVVVSAKLEDGIAIVVGHLTCRLIVIIDGKLEFLTHFGDGYGVGTESAWWQPHLGNFHNWAVAIGENHLLIALEQWQRLVV